MIVQMYCGDGIRAGEFFLGLLKVGIHINLTGDVLNILENGRKQKKGNLHHSTKSKRFQKAMVSGSKHVARLLSASRFQQAARDAKELPIALAETETGTQPGDQERGMMRAHYLARCAANEAASAASARGEERSASIHATVARYHGRAVYRCRQAASLEAYFQNNSTILNLYKLDLHGLHVADALEILKYHIIHLHSLEHPGSWLMKVVTGVGHHSEDGVAKVQPAVIDYLADAGYVFDVEDMNPGIVRILLERRERDAVLEFASLS